MADYPIFAFTALLVLGYGLFSKLSDRSVITAPMVFVSIGILVSFFLNDFVKANAEADFVKVIAELALVLVLFSDASTINLRNLKKEKKLPLRLLLIGLPMTMAFGFFMAIPLFPSSSFWALALMAFILSPTDAALGQAVVTSKMIPEKIRQAINVESGLNDGIALPPILVCIAVLTTTSQVDTTINYWLFFTLKQFVFGPLIGGFIGWAGGWLVDKASTKDWMNPTFQRLSSIALAILAYSFAEMAHGNGFIAAFFAGLLLGAHSPKIRERIQEFGEAESQALALFIFLIFGILIVPVAVPFWNLTTLVYALLSLTVIRMVPVAISLLGTKMSWRTVAFIGWFGPRGIASVLYLLLVVIAIGVKGFEQLLSVIVLTVLLSIFLHGFTAVPLSKIFKGKS